MAADRNSSGGHGRDSRVPTGRGDLPAGTDAVTARRDELRASIRAIEAGLPVRAGAGGHAGTSAVATAHGLDDDSDPADGAGVASTPAPQPVSRPAQSPHRIAAVGRGGGEPRRQRPRPDPSADLDPAWLDAGQDEPGWPGSGANPGPSLEAGPETARPETAFEDPASAPSSGLFDDDAPPRERRRGAREQSPTQRALGLLTRREHSRKELTRKLKARGLEVGEVEQAVDRLAEAGWQNDERFAESLVRSRAGNGYGPLYIRAELATHGLPADAIAAALAAYEGDWGENARDLVRRRFGEGHAADPKLRRKAADLLLRRGFDGETARNANRSRDPD